MTDPGRSDTAPIEFYDDSAEPGDAGAVAEPEDGRAVATPEPESETEPHAPGAPTRKQRTRSSRRVGGAVLAALILAAAAVAAWFLMPRPEAPIPVPAPAGPTYEVVRVVEGPGVGDRPKFDRPLGAAFGEDGSIYVSDSGNARVCVFDADGRFVREFGREGDAGTPRTAALAMPVGLDVDASGTVHVADLRAGVVRVFDARGVYRRGIAPPEPDVPTGWRPTDVAVSPLGVFVADATGVERFSRGGRSIGRLEASPTVTFDHPNGVAVAEDGTVLVSDTNNARVVAVSAVGSLRWITEGALLRGGRIGLPRGIAVAPEGGAYVADAFGFDVVRISEEGTLTSRYGGRGSEEGRFEFPNDVDVRGDLLLVTDKENDRVQVLRLLR